MATTQHVIDQVTRAEEAPHRLGMARTLRRVAVLGAGTMGARVAAHFANAGVPALLLSRATATALKGIETAAKQKPANFFADDIKRLVKPGNYDENIKELAGCDWIIETAAENLQIKRDLWTRVAAYAKPDAILSTTTSGIPLAKIVEGFPQQFRKQFLGAHFMNPPRYMHLLEVIPGPETDPATLEFVSEFASRRLGKGVVLCKDTPDFIANRIGCFFGATVSKIVDEDGYTIEEADALTGPLIGLPNSASFRMLDLVGLDVWAEVGPTLYANIPHDPWRDRFLLPEWEKRMIERKWLGEKTGQGFYKRVAKGDEKEIWAIDLKTLEYHPMQKAQFPSVEAVKAIENLPERVNALLDGDDRAGRFLRKVFADYFIYSAEKIPEISDRIVEIDRSLRWGYGHKLGPFEFWDALGFEKTARRFEKEGRALPENVQTMLSRGVTSFYLPPDGSPQMKYFDFAIKDYQPVEPRPGVLVLSDVKRSKGVIRQNPGASLVDVGDGVLCVEFHSKMNAIGNDIITMLFAGLEETEKNFDAMIVANEGENFSVGGDLLGILLAAQEGEWDELNSMLDRIQKANMAMKYAAKPVVSAPFNRTLGGGCEIVLHTRPQVSAELYMGLVEFGVGLVPSAGGCKELILRTKGDARKVFELVGFAKVSLSAQEAKNLGLLEDCAPVSMNSERLIGDAKTYALSLAPNWVPGAPRNDVKVPGEAGFALMKLGAWMARQGEYITDHDMVIAEKLAHVLSGGRLAGEQLVSEQYLLDLEREAFLSLCGTEKTRARIAYTLKTGKPLRN